MKRYILIAVAAALVLVAGSAVAYAVGEVRDRAAPEVLDPVAYLEEEAAGVGSGALEVPVYSEQALVKPDNLIFRFGRDNGYRKDLGSRGESIEALQEFFPSAAIRRTAEGESYVMYDTDGGGRLYVFFSANNDYMFVTGYPVLMKKKLPYGDFAGIEVGDGITEVENADPVATTYREFFDGFTDVETEHYTKVWGLPPTSVHLLTDGMLKIEYRRDADLGYAITNMIYAPDFVLDGFEGKISYKIDEADYVQ
ncbi:MAG: hypothetical protein ACYCX3_08660 [Thermoleophilia bacterium]